MLRLFKESLTRNIFDLDGMWNYCTDPAGTAVWGSGLPEDKQCIAIPGCFNTEPGLLNYEGDVWMETAFYTAKPNIRLVFGGVNNECDVYVDGKHLGHHWGPFTEFAYTLEKFPAGEHKLVVRLSNLHNNQDTLPLSVVDWFHYGGIIRSVEVHEFADTAVDAFKIEYTLDGDNADLTVTANLRAFRQTDAPVRLYCEGTMLAETEISLLGEGQAVLTANLDNITRWNPDNPKLYTFTVEFDGDSLRDRTGFRTIEIKDRQFLLNGKVFKLKGINRHEVHPDWGFAVPLKIAKRDMDIIRQMGCNFTRGGHYPNAKTTLDYMDQTGMPFWEEIPIWQFHESHLVNPVVIERGNYLHTEMVKRDYNHPCILFWGLCNEVDSDTAGGKETIAKFRETIEKQDKTRLITFASNRPLWDESFDLVDFISINHYAGWYNGPLDDWPNFLDKLAAYAESTGNGHKPIVLSEFGFGGIYGDHELEGDVFWSENYQADALSYAIDVLDKHPKINGLLIWQFCDIRAGFKSSPAGIKHILARPRSFNNKGLFNEYRRPKMAYFTVKKIYRGE